MVFRKIVAERLTALRKAAGKTQQDVAADLGVSVSAIAMYETGERMPRDEVKIALARSYHRSVADIFFKDPVHCK